MKAYNFEIQRLFKVKKKKKSKAENLRGFVYATPKFRISENWKILLAAHFQF